MARKAGVSDGLFYVSLDRSTAEDACSKRKRVVSREAPDGHHEGRGLPRQVLRQFLLLCKARIRFFFWEMDLWLPPRPSGPSVVDVFRAAAATDTAGLNPGGVGVARGQSVYDKHRVAPHRCGY